MLQEVIIVVVFLAIVLGLCKWWEDRDISKDANDKHNKDVV